LPTHSNGGGGTLRPTADANWWQEITCVSGSRQLCIAVVVIFLPPRRTGECC